MNALKKLVVVLLTIVAGFNGYAVRPSEEDVDNYKASVSSFLRTEGYMPQVDGDGDIAFKHDGDKYWIQASAYDDGYYVTLMTLTSVKDIDINKIRRVMDETAQGLKYVRLYTVNGTVVNTSYSWYCVSISDFKRMFSNALSVVSTADSRLIQGLYSK